MNYSPKETETGFKYFHTLVIANKEAEFELTMPYGDVLVVKYDMDFEDDLSSTDDNFQELEFFQSISFKITKVSKNLSKGYTKGQYIIINYRTMPASYKLLDTKKC